MTDKRRVYVDRVVGPGVFSREDRLRGLVCSGKVPAGVSL